MRVLVYGRPKILPEVDARGVGHLLHPKQGNKLDQLLADGLPWASDNGAFSGFDEVAFTRHLRALAGRPGCRWVAAPDVVADAAATLELFQEWEPRIRAHGLPVALVAQDGLEPHQVPWERVDAIFVGGSTEWKLGPEAEAVALEARRRGKLVHVGRVNSRKRMLIAHRMGADTVDGSSFNRFPNTYLPDAAAFAATLPAAA